MKLRGISTVFKKEVKDMFRDRKTLIVGILIPLLIFPVIFGIMGKSIEKSTTGVTENMKIALEDKGDSSLGKFLKSQKNVSIIESADIKKDVLEGKVYIGVIIPENFDTAVTQEKPGDITIVSDDSSQSSGMTQSSIEGLIAGYSQQIVATRLAAKGIDVSILNPVSIKRDTVSKNEEENGFAKFMLSLMLPLLLVMYAVSSPMAASIDVGAGEKERGTLEPLLTTQISRMNLLFGKLFAVTLMGVIGIIASIIGLLISMKIAPGIFGGGEGGSGIGLSVNSLLLMGLVTILLTMVFSALELSISVYARSFKEAQTYLTPLTIVGMAAAYGTYMMEAKNISTLLFNIPIVNVSLIIKELIAGIYNPTHLFITFGWNIVYVAISIGFATYMFSKESVIFRT